MTPANNLNLFRKVCEIIEIHANGQSDDNSTHIQLNNEIHQLKRNKTFKTLDRET